MGNSGQATVFGKRKEPHTVIIARGDQLRHFTLRPWAAILAASAIAVVAVGYVLATSYLVFRDDLIGASVARQARLQQDYEDRISALRAQVDRITSRQLLDQQLVEGKVTELLERADALSARSGKIGKLLSSGDPLAHDGGLPDAAPAPAPKPDLAAMLFDRAPALAAATGLTASAGERSAADRADLMFVFINRSLHDIESQQLARLERLTNDAYRNADGITGALETAGLKVEKDGADAVGGPLVPVGGDEFDAKVNDLDAALAKLEAVRGEARRLPLANPAPDHAVTSTFGVRADPLLGTPAMHTGLDFRTSVGTRVAATAPGTVVKAGWNGGYGQMVEIDHGHGFSTRYAHLSRLDVTEGERVRAGQEVGETGSTGRSTGPHLHYEVREGGAPVDPAPFLKIGRAIKPFM